LLPVPLIPFPNNPTGIPSHPNYSSELFAAFIPIPILSGSTVIIHLRLVAARRAGPGRARGTALTFKLFVLPCIQYPVTCIHHVSCHVMAYRNVSHAAKPVCREGYVMATCVRVELQETCP